MRLTQEAIDTQKQLFIDLINSIERDFDKKRLIDWLENKSDFFTAPASSKNHCAFKGGLCMHSLNVFYTLEKLAQTFLPENYPEKKEEDKRNNIKYNKDTLKIVALLHDISKANYYEKYKRNVKDNNGNWVQVEEYKTKENRFIYGNDEQTAEFMVSTFIPLTVEEKVALLHKSGGKAFDSTQTYIPIIFESYDLATLLHCADMLSCYIIEKDYDYE